MKISKAMFQILDRRRPKEVCFAQTKKKTLLCTQKGRKFWFCFKSSAKFRNCVYQVISKIVPSFGQQTLTRNWQRRNFLLVQWAFFFKHDAKKSEFWKENGRLKVFRNARWDLNKLTQGYRIKISNPFVIQET